MCIKIRYKLIGNRFLWDVIYHPCLYLNGGLTVPRLMLMDWLFTTFKNVVCIYYLWMLNHRAWRRRIHSDGTSHIILQTHCFDNIFAGSTATTKLAICFTDISILYYYLWKHNMQIHSLNSLLNIWQCDVDWSSVDRSQLFLEIRTLAYSVFHSDAISHFV